MRFFGPIGCGNIAPLGSISGKTFQERIVALLERSAQDDFAGPINLFDTDRAGIPKIGGKLFGLSRCAREPKRVHRTV